MSDEALGRAYRSKDRLRRNFRSRVFREQVVDTFLSDGHYDDWIDVFKDDGDMVH